MQVFLACSPVLDLLTLAHPIFLHLLSSFAFFTWFPLVLSIAFTDMSNAESTTRPQKDHSNLSKGRPGSERRKGSLQSTHSSGWGWPRFVSVEVDVEEKRRQKPNEMAPVNATGEMSRPEQGTRNQSLQKAHERVSQSYLRHKPSAKPEGSEE